MYMDFFHDSTSQIVSDTIKVVAGGTAVTALPSLTGVQHNDFIVLATALYQGVIALGTIYLMFRNILTAKK